jgi:hypothetical protein
MSQKKARILIVLLVGVALLGVAQSSHAQAFAGNKCWQLSPFIDTVKMALTTYPTGDNGGPVRWRAGSPALYQLQGAGVLSPDATVPGSALLTFAGAGDTFDFLCTPGTACVCTFTGHAVGTGGTWFFNCNSGFSNSGTLTLLPACPAGSTHDAPSGRRAGEAH